jgi:hypothetical protein
LRGQHRGYRQHLGQRLDRLFGRLAQRLQPRAAFGLDLDRESDVAVAHNDPGHHAERDDVGTLFGIDDAPQRIQDLSLGDGGHFVLLPERRGNSVADGNPSSTAASAPLDTRDLGRAAPLDNTRPRALYRTAAGGAVARRSPGGPQPL